MQKKGQLERLKQGADAWNLWRAQNSRIAPDLRWVDLSEANLTGVDLSRADLSRANLSGANLGAVNLGAAIFFEANLLRADLFKANLREADLHRANLQRADLREADLGKANLGEADLRAAKLRGADLREANLGEANLGEANLFEANLRWVDLRWVDLRGADLHGADLRGANLQGADLRGADLNDSTIAYTTLGDIDLGEVKGLETVRHLGPSTIGVDAIYRSNANIPEVFLRGAGVPDNFITYMNSLVVRPIEYYSCFISYSTKDEDFAKHLYAHLQSEHVRCWFAPEDLKIGDRFRTRINEAIRIYDKLLLVLSKNSIESPWVEDEVEAAFEKERKEKKFVLFPIRLDDVVMTASQAWAVRVRRIVHMGDFTGWKEHDQYKKVFTQLLRGLKADDKATVRSESASQS